MSDVRPEPELDPEVLQGLLRGVEEFNQGKYFECHETLEEIWRGIRGPARDLFQGLIQVSVGFYHLRNGNLRGGESQLKKGLAKLSGFGDRYLGMDLADLRREIHAWLERVGSGELIVGSGLTAPKYRYTPPLPFEGNAARDPVDND